MKNPNSQRQYRRQLETQSVNRLSTSHWLNQCLMFVILCVTANMSFGAIDGQAVGLAGTNDRGAFTYQYPIEVPPGVNGHSAPLSLNYSSQRKSMGGTAGVGWELMGISSITRCGQTRAFDQFGVRNSPLSGIYDGTSTDRLCLDGNPLINTKGASDYDYWNPGSTDYYEPSITDGSKITVRSWACTNVTPAPCSFERTMKDGTVMIYGGSLGAKGLDAGDSNSGPFTQWNVTDITDKDGNSITYGYGRMVGHSLIDSITYNKAKIKFVYTTMPLNDKVRGWVNSAPTAQVSEIYVLDKRLHSIHIYSTATGSDVKYKEYKLYYDTSGTTKRQRLTRIKDCSWTTGSSICKTPETNFSYNNHTFTGDFMRDLQPNLDLDGISDGFGGIFSDEKYNMNATYVDPCGATLIPGDWNSDGRTDFIRQEIAGRVANSCLGDNNYSFGFYIAKGDPGSVTFDVQFPSNSQADHKGYHQGTDDTDEDSLQEVYGYNIIPGDFNGDGKLDYIKQAVGHDAADHNFVFMIAFNLGNDANGFPTFQKYWPNTPTYQTKLSGWHRHNDVSWQGAEIIVADFNGDGSDDFMRMESGVWANDQDQSVTIYFSDGSTEDDGFFTIYNPVLSDVQNRIRTGITCWTYYTCNTNIIPGDFNGDGISDFIRQEDGFWAYDELNNFEVFLGRGDGEFTRITSTETVDMQDGKLLKSIQYHLKGIRLNLNIDVGSGIIPTDLNGDGKTDFIHQRMGEIAHYGDDGYFGAWLSQGDGTFEFVYQSGSGFQRSLLGAATEGVDDFPTNIDGAHGSKITMMDANGDGFADILRQPGFVWNNTAGESETNPNGVYIYLGRGDGTFDPKLIPTASEMQTDLPGIHGIHVGQGEYGRRVVEIIPGDFDGDGHIDFIGQRSGYHNADTQSIPDWAVYLNEASYYPHEDLMKTVKTNKSTSTITYKDITDDGFVTETFTGHVWSDTEVRYETAPISVVKSVSTVPDTSATETATDMVTYGYGKPIAGIESSFLGFTRIAEISTAKNLKTWKNYQNSRRNGTQFFAPVETGTDENSTGNPIIKSEVTWTEGQIYFWPSPPNSTAPGANPMKQLKLSETITSYYGSNTVTELKEFTYDTDLDVLGERTTIGSDVSTSVVQYTTHANGLKRAWNQKFCTGGTLSNGVLSCDSNDLVGKSVSVLNGDGDITKLKQFSVGGVYLSTDYTYNSNGTIATETGPNGLVTSYVYDSASHLSSKTLDPTGANLTTTYDYDENTGKVLEVTDPNGTTVSTTYDGFGRLDSVTKEVSDGVDSTTDEYSYYWENDAAQGDVLTAKLTVHHKFDGVSVDHYEYSSTNVFGRKVEYRLESSDGNFVEQWRYNAAGLEDRHLLYKSTADADLYVYSTYDTAGRLTLADFAIGNDISTAYAAEDTTCDAVDNNSIKITVTQSNRSYFRCVNLRGDDVMVRTNGKGSTSTQYFEYDVKGRTTKMTDAAGLETTYTYDWLNNKTSVNNDQRGDELYTYAATSTGLRSEWLHKGTDGSTLGSATYTYDQLGRTTQVTYNDGLKGIYTYDSATLNNNKGRLSTETIKQGTTTILENEYAYTNLGKVSEKSTTVGGETYVSSYDYAWGGELETITSASGQTIEYGYNDDASIASVVTSDGTTTFAGYNGSGRYDLATYPNGTTEERVHDAYQRLERNKVKKGSTTVLNLRYYYNGYQQLKDVDDQQTPANDQHYNYDYYFQITRAKGPYGSESYTYDTSGNLLTKGGVSYTYNADKLLTSYGSTSLTYNKAGSVLTKGSRTNTYNAQQMLTSSTVGSTATTFEYHSNGQRFAKHNDDGKTVYYIDENLEVLRDGTNQQYTDNIMGPEGLMATITSTMAPAMAAYYKHDKIADMYNKWSVGGLVGWAYHSVAKIISHPKVLDVLGLLIAAAWLMFVGLFVRNHMRSLRAAKLGEDDVYGTEFMRDHRGLSAGAPLALAGVLAFSIVFTPGFVENALAVDGNPETGVQYFYHDTIGSNRLVADGSGNTVAKPIYKPFGELYAGGDDSYRYGFTGKEIDETDLMYFEARYYDPEIGRFTTADTYAIGAVNYTATRLNRYAYVQNDPINNIDPTGNLAFATIAAISFFIGIAASAIAGGITAAVQGKKFNGIQFLINVGISALMAPLAVFGTAAVGAWLSARMAAQGFSMIVAGHAVANIGRQVAHGMVTALIVSAPLTLVSQAFEAAQPNKSWSWKQVGIGIALDVAFAGVGFSTKTGSATSAIGKQQAQDSTKKFFQHQMKMALKPVQAQAGRFAGQTPADVLLAATKSVKSSKLKFVRWSINKKNTGPAGSMFKELRPMERAANIRNIFASVTNVPDLAKRTQVGLEVVKGVINGVKSNSANLAKMRVAD